MNKFRLLISIFCLLAGTAFAQQFKAGVLTGIATSQISGDELAGYNKAGFVAGGFVETALSKKFDLAMEIMFIQKGSKKNADPEKEDYTSYRLRLNYFEVPLMVQWNFSKRFTFEAGPTFGALLSSDEEDQDGSLNDYQPPFKKSEIGLAGGMKVNFAQRFAGTARIESSMLPVREHAGGVTYHLNKGQYNAVLSFTVQYTFGKRGETNE